MRRAVASAAFVLLATTSALSLGGCGGGKGGGGLGTDGGASGGAADSDGATGLGGATDVGGAGGGIGLPTIVAGGLFACGVRANGTVACWGENFRGAHLVPPDFP